MLLIKRFFVFLFSALLILFITAIALLYAKQKQLVQELLVTVNQSFKAELQINDSHIDPFTTFPHVAIDLKDIKVFANKSKTDSPLVHLNDLYIGFDVWSLLQGKVDIKSINLSNGFIHLVQDTNGVINLTDAFATKSTSDTLEKALHLHLQALKLKSIDITHLNHANQVTTEALIYDAQSSFKTNGSHTDLDIHTNILLNIVAGKDTTFFKHKHITLTTALDVDHALHALHIKPSTIQLEQAKFDLNGHINLTGDHFADISLKGHKPNFDLFMAFAPEELTPVLKQFDNKGQIFFDATLKGPLLSNQLPFINVDFGCSDAYLHNVTTNKKLDALNFKAHFTNNGQHGLEAMSFSLTDFSSKPEAGVFSGHFSLKNFASPEIDTQLISDFDLDFLAKFLNIEGLRDLKGKVKLTLNFHDVIDFAHPEKSIEKLNESYFTELIVSDLSFGAKTFNLPIKDININAVMEGHQAVIKRFDAKIASSDIHINGSVSDLPAILHHTKNSVECRFEIQSKQINLKELTASDTSLAMDEVIYNLKSHLHFNTTANAFTESPYLPIGEFFIDDLTAQLKNYPHAIQALHADVIIDSSLIKLIDFSGKLDASDFHFTGLLNGYELWFKPKAVGDAKLAFDLTSNQLRLHDVFTYNGENYVPEDYRHEVFSLLKLKGHANLHFNDSLVSSDLYLDHFTTKMKLHHYAFEKFKGRIHFEDNHLMVEDFQAHIGKSAMTLQLNYYLGSSEAIKKRDNHFGLSAEKLDLNELLAYTLSTTPSTLSAAQHDQGFSILDWPFTHMSFDLAIKDFTYHQYHVKNLMAKARTAPHTMLYIDTLYTQVADGALKFRGYLNGSKPNQIYIQPRLQLLQVDLDKLLIKFENFGQEHLVSENVHGKLSGILHGTIKVHKDLMPILDDSELHMDMQVLDGRLDNYAPLMAMAGYFKDKNTARVKFDTLQNHIDLKKGVLSFPMMTINSSLGFMEIKGQQDMNFNMQYTFRIPLKMVSDVAKSKFLSGKTDSIPQNREDEIVYKDSSKRTRYLTMQLIGKDGQYNVSLSKAP